MQRDTAVAIVLALLALLAIGAAAATLENPAASSSGSGFGGGSGDGLGSGSAASGSTNGSSGGGAMQWTGELSGACLSILMTPWAKALIAGSVLLVAASVWRRTGSIWFGAITLVLYGPIVYVVWFALAGCRTLQPAMAPSRPATNQTQTNGSAGGAGGLGSVADTATSQSSLLLLAVIVVLVLAAVVLLYLASADDLVDSQLDREREESDDDYTDIAAVGRLAGEAADRIEAGDAFGNEVYRAWVEMTEHLAVERPQSSTPAEFAAAAVDAGMAPDDVRELTDLFEEVRYGDREVTEERERRAAAALRRIEAGYAEDEE
ncbi:hypothetical protein JCM30237_10980 [Halolamina litorea]|uniref:DUF4129 domain-containing protein n=1 Tax=Halolamina litorea TaxID=1515593 RepID=A0ABD6BMP0_9EURY|nr:DUF4129 domain-containing protein [Halolamina litorea]